jgi:hypothetical protein
MLMQDVQGSSFTHSPTTEHEDGRVPEQIWTAMEKILNIPTRAQTAAVHHIATHFSHLTFWHPNFLNFFSTPCM